MAFDFQVFLDGTDISALACPNIKYGGSSPGGDVSCEWTQKVLPDPNFGPSGCPGAYRIVSLVTGGNEFRRFRIAGWDVPVWDCSLVGDVQITGEGLSANLNDRTFAEVNSLTHSGIVIFGPSPVPNMMVDPTDPLKRALIVNPGLPMVQKTGLPILALTPKASVIYAVTQLCEQLSVDPANVGGEEILTRPTRDFYLNYAQQVVDEFTGFYVGLATPFRMHVRAGKFFWKPLDGGRRYSVDLNDGAKMSIRFDPRQIRNRVNVGYGKNQAATSTSASHALIPITRDMPVHLGDTQSAPVTQYGEALEWAENIKTQQEAAQQCWAYTITIPKSCAVYDFGAPIKGLQMLEGYGIHIGGMNGARLSPHAAAPEDVTIASVSYDAHSGVTTVICGPTKLQVGTSMVRGMTLTRAMLSDVAKALPDVIYGVPDRSTWDPGKISVPTGSTITTTPPIPGNAQFHESPVVAGVNSGPPHTAPQSTPQYRPVGSFHPACPMLPNPPGQMTEINSLGIEACRITGYEIYASKVVPAAEFLFKAFSLNEELFIANTAGMAHDVARDAYSKVQLFSEDPNSVAPMILIPRPETLRCFIKTPNVDPDLQWLTIVVRLEPAYPGVFNTMRDSEGNVILDADGNRPAMGIDFKLIRPLSP